MQILPIHYVGFELLFLGFAFLIAEALLPTFGALGSAGIAAFVIGALMLIDTSVPGYGMSLASVAAVAAFGMLFIFTASRMALRARRRPVVTGPEALIGSLGVVLDEGVRAHGAGTLTEPVVGAGADSGADSGMDSGAASSTGASVGTSAAPRVGTSVGTTAASGTGTGAGVSTGVRTGWARVHGERWQVICAAPLTPGHTVRVTARHGLTLTVVPADASTQLASRMGEPT